MKDVFISYASEDRVIAQRLAQAIEVAGVSVWWDRQIQVGSEWDKTIEDALAAAKCVIVLWTARAKASRWVRAEARAALKDEKVVPVMLEADAIPLAFTGIQALRSLGWDGSAGTKPFSILLEVVQGKLAGKPIVLPEKVSTKASWVGKAAALIGVKTIFAGVVAILLVASSFWRLDADVAIQVQTGRIEFRVHPGLDQKRLTDPLFFSTLSVQHVEEVSFSPTQLYVANPEELDWNTDTYPPKAWVSLSGDDHTWTFQPSPARINPLVTFESVEHTDSPTGRLDALVLSQPATVTLEHMLRQTMTATIRTDNGRPRAVLSNFHQVEMVEEGLRIEPGNTVPFSQDQELTYRALFSHTSGTITVGGKESMLVLVINPSQVEENTVFSHTELPVDSVDVSWQDPTTGERRSHPKFHGTVRYRSIPDFPEVSFQSPMFLTVDELEHFEILSIRLDPTKETLVIEMQGTAGYLTTGTRNNPRDLRPTVFDVIRFHPVLKPLRNLIGL